MNDDVKAGITALLAVSRTAFLASQRESGPESSMAPFAMFEGNPLLHLSGLARHSKNLAANPRAGLMICTPEQPEQSVLALPRLSLQGEVVAVPESELSAAKRAYLARIPDAEPLFDFPDFRLCMLRVERIYWVGGFGSAREIPLAAWQSMLGSIETPK